MMIRSLRTPVTLSVAMLALLAAGCGGDDDSASAPATQTTATTQADPGKIGVEASEMKFALTAPSAPEGKVTFNVKNVGAVKHEMVVIKTDKSAGKLPVENGEVDESGSIGEIGSDKLPPGGSASATFDMKSGHYALICALPGHYQAGMYKNFIVR